MELRDSHPLVAHLDEIAYQVKHHDVDHVGLFTGKERTGKSGYAHLAQCIVDPEWDPREQCHWSGRTYMRASMKIPPGRSIRLDEPTKGATSYRFMGGDNTDLADYWTTNGFRNQIHMILSPTLKWATPILTNHRASHNYHALKRYPGSHVVAQIRMLQDEDGNLYDKPRVIDTFDVPPPRGPKWELEKKLKAAFADAVASGSSAQQDEFQTVKSRMIDRLAIFD